VLAAALKIPLDISHPLLPLHWVAAAVETSDHRKRFVIFDNEQKRVGKTSQQGSADGLINRGELARVVTYSLDYRVNRRSETWA
jgi:hypothetical protein